MLELIKNFIKTKQGIFLLFIVTIAAFLRFYSIGNVDLIGDGTHYSFRALGWFDFMGAGGNQTTPIQWFGYIPWWAKLSFHDHPPLVFLIQHLFFRFFGDTPFMAHLPFILFGLANVVLVYFLALVYKRNYLYGLLPAGILAIANYSVWASRTNYLEGIQVFFIILSIFFFLKFLKKDKQKFLYLCAASAGLAMLSKYTALFLIPSIILFLAWEKREIFKKIYCYKALLIVLLVLLPIIIYNFQVFKTRHHFDVGLSAIVGMHPEDYKIIAERGTNFNFINNLQSFFLTIYHNVSHPLFWTWIIALIYFSYKIKNRKSDYLEKFILLSLIMLAGMFLFIGGPAHYLSIVSPFIALLTGLFLADAWQWLKNRNKKILTYLLSLIIGLILVFEFNSTAEKNIKNPPYAKGWNALDEYLRKNILSKEKKLQKINDLYSFAEIDKIEPNDNIVFFDERMDWFAYTWYIQRHNYYGRPVISYKNFSDDLIKEYGEDVDPIKFLKERRIAGFYFIEAIDESVLDGIKKNIEYLSEQVESLTFYLDHYYTSFIDISNPEGRPVFRIYYFNL